MNDEQLLRQVAYKLTSAQWPDATALFDAVTFAPPGAIQESHMESQGRVALVTLGDQETDANEPKALRQTVHVLLHHATEDVDDEGDDARLGAKGLLRLVEQVRGVLRYLGEESGVRMEFVSQGASSASDLAWASGASRELIFEAHIADERDYPGPTRLKATALGGGQVSLTWTRAPDRFDRHSQVLRRASGSTAPTSISGGTGVTISAAATSVTDSPGAGTWSYAIFAGYDDTFPQDGASNEYSTPDAQSKATVVAS